MSKLKFIEIELILINDNSFDNRVKHIDIYKKEDKRNILIKNKKNRGTFFARNLGVLISKAKYIIILIQMILYWTIF